MPLACGCIGQETTGAGGFAQGAANGSGRARDRRPRPRARSSRMRGSWTSRTRSESSRGRCSTPAIARSGSATSRSGSSATFARMLGVAPERVVVDQVGLNHLTWVRARPRRRRGRAAGAARRARRRARRRTSALPRRLLDELGAIPSYYLRYFYAHDSVLAEQLDGIPRAAAVAEIERELLELYRDPELAEKPTLLEQRGGAFYSEAATGLVASLVSGSGEVHEVDIRNNGTLAGLADDDVVEVPARVGATAPGPAAAASARARAARARPARRRLRAARGRSGADAATRSTRARRCSRIRSSASGSPSTSSSSALAR